MKLTPTTEQHAIISLATDTSANLQVIARAGAAKTSTLVMIAEALPATQILCLAFNKRIAVEMAERLPENCTSLTLNSIGHRAWGKFLRKRLNLDTKKTYDIMSNLIKTLDPEEQTEAWEFFAETLAAVGHSKNCGWVPQSYPGYWKPLMKDETFFATLDFEPSDLQRELLIATATLSFKQCLQGTIDFADQLLTAAICPVEFPRYPLTLIDEAQDLSHLNHVMLTKIVGRARIIAVGDPCQAIYAFRGAATDSMPQLATRFKMETAYLTICFRCASSVVENAQWRAPDMRYPDTAPVGSVQRHIGWSASDVPDGSAIICRNNAPLFRMAIKLLSNNRLPLLSGRDVVTGLVKIMKKLGKQSLSREGAQRKLDNWRRKELERTRHPGSVNDRAECIGIFLEETNTLGDAIAYLEALFKRDGRIELMTGHKSKGLEFTDVFFLDQKLLTKAGDGQDDNLRYVIETRAKLNLHYVDSSDFADNVREVAV